MNDDRFDVLDRFAPLFEAPEPPFEGFERRRDTKRRNQRITAGTVGIAVFVAAVWFVTSGSPFDRTQTPGASGPTVATGPTVPSGSNMFPRTLSRSVKGVPFTLTVPDGNWADGPITRLPDGSGFREGDILISQSITGPQGAEAVIFWTRFPDGNQASACADLLDPSLGPAASDLAAAVAAAPGTELLEGPSDVTVGGYPAKHVLLRVREDRGCDPGYFYTWRGGCWGMCWVETNKDDTIELWIVDVAGKLLFIEAETTTQADSDLEREIQQIVRSIRFEPEET
jgi:hypothetical protein